MLNKTPHESVVNAVLFFNAVTICVLVCMMLNRTLNECRMTMLSYSLRMSQVVSLVRIMLNENPS